MRPPILPLLGIFTLGSCTLLTAAEPLASILPENSTFFWNVSNFSKIRESINHPLMQGPGATKLREALKPVFDKLKGEVDSASAATLKEETGLTLEEILAKFPGAAAGSFTIPFTGFLDQDMEEASKNIGISIVADYTGDEALMEKILNATDKLEDQATANRKKAEAEAEAAAKDEEDEEEDEDEDEDEEEEEEAKPQAEWPENYEEKVTEVDGTKVHEWTVKDPDKFSGFAKSWAVGHGKAVIAAGATDIKEIVARLAKPAAAGSLGGTEAWKTLPESASEADVLAGVNLERMLGEIQEGIRVKMEKGEMNTGLPINPLQAWTGAGLDKLRLAYLINDLRADDLAVQAGLTYQEKPAMLKVYAATGPGTPPAFVPSDVQEASWGTLDWGAMFDNLKELLTAVSPMAAGGMDSGLEEAKKMLGVDLRKDLFGQMGDGLWSVSHTEPESAEEESEELDGMPAGMGAILAMAEGQAQVIGISLRDAKAFELSLKTIFNTVAPGKALFEDREYLGKTIHRLKDTPEKLPIAWLIHNDTFILSVGKMDLLDKVLGGMDKKPARPLINEPHVKEAFAKLPDGQVSSGYIDAGQLIDVIISALKGGFEEMATGETAEMLEKMPDSLNLPWFSVTRAYLGDKSAEVRVNLSAKP